MYYKTRAEFTVTDCEFIAETIGKTAEEKSAILQLANDPGTVTELLHKEELFDRSITVPPVFLSISPQLFFYVFIYRALDRKHLANDDVVDYVAGICVEFRTNEALWHFSSTGEKTIYAVNLLNFMNDIDQHQQYFLRRYIGNASLFLTGFFPDPIFHRSRKRGAPPMEYYESIGRSQYGTAAESSHTYDAGAAPVLNTLAEQFVAIRSALNVYTDTYLNLHSGKRSLEMIERQANTLDEQTFRDSLEL